jgi:hypothetical protein
MATGSFPWRAAGKGSAEDVKVFHNGRYAPLTFAGLADRVARANQAQPRELARSEIRFGRASPSPRPAWGNRRRPQGPRGVYCSALKTSARRVSRRRYSRGTTVRNSCGASACVLGLDRVHSRPLHDGRHESKMCRLVKSRSRTAKRKSE